MFAKFLRCKSGFLFEECTEIMRIVISTLVGNLRAHDAGRAEQFFGMINPEVIEIISEGFTDFLAEEGTKMIGTEIELGCHFVHL